MEFRDESSSNVGAILKIEEMAQKIISQMQEISVELTKMKSADNSWRQEFETKMVDLIDQKYKLE